MAATTIFISYRRDDSVGHAGRLFDRLAEQFGRDCVFRDIDTIAAGDDFVEAVREKIAKCEVMLVLIGPRWLTAADDAGRWRLADEADLVRIEIELALARNIRVIPLLLQGAMMPREKDLPGALAKLARRNAVELRDTAFDADVAQLVTTLAPSGWRRLQRALVRRPVIAAVALVIAGLAGAWLYPQWALTPERARLQLGQMGLGFDAETFVASAAKRDAQAVNLFLRAGMAADARNRKGESAVDMAAREGDLALVKTLVERGAGTSAALSLAAGWGRKEVLNFLLARKPSREVLGNALGNAAGQRDIDIAKALLDQGADANAKGGRYAGTALGEAAATLKPAMVQLLLERGAEAGLASEYGVTPLHAAISATRTGDDAALDRAQLDIVKTLLDKGAGIEARMHSMETWQPTPLLLAIHEKRSAIALFLIERGADVNASCGDVSASTPRMLSVLMQASAQGLREVVQAALARGAVVDARNETGETALLFAAANRSPEQGKIMRVLLAAGADAKLVSAGRQTLLMRLVRSAHDVGIDLVQEIIDRGVNVNAADQNGWTALMNAVRDHQLEAARLLLAHGARRDMKNSDGENALKIAVQVDDRPIQQLLGSTLP